MVPSSEYLGQRAAGSAILGDDSFDPFSFHHDGLSASEADVSVRLLRLSAVVVVIDEGVDLGFQVARQIIVFKQDAVFERLVPALDLALRGPLPSARPAHERLLSSSESERL
jgi:hypothetical protein